MSLAQPTTVTSISHTPGSEGKPLIKGSHKGKAVAVWTSGGDSQGMNAAVRAVVRTGMFLGCKVYLINEGYQGMIDGGSNIVLAEWHSVSGIIHLGGTVIGSARCMDFKERSGRLKAVYNLVTRGIANLVCIGGDGSLTGANLFRQEWTDLLNELVQSKQVTPEQAQACERLNLVGIVGSIDNDFCGTDMTIGTDSALFRIIEAVDNIASTAYSHKRCFVLEVMGRHCGYLAVISAIAAEADYVFAPEWPPENWEEEMCNKLEKAKNRGQRVCIVIVAEGAIDRSNKPITADQIKNVISSKVGLDTRVTILGHVQRGGNPSAYDRILGGRMGSDAVVALMESSLEQPPCVIGVNGNQIVRIPLMEAVETTKMTAKAVDSGNFREAVELRGRAYKFNLEIYLLFSNIDSPNVDSDQATKKRTIGLVTVGEPASGMNAAMRAFVRFSSTHGFRVLGVQDGFAGLVNDRLQLSVEKCHSGLHQVFVCTSTACMAHLAEIVRELCWNDVVGWASLGGSCLRTNSVTPDRVGLQKVADQMKKYEFSALLIIGGFEAFQSALILAQSRIRFSEFCVPMCVMPAAFLNNVPGTDFCIGADTALNEITQICDRMKSIAAGGQSRVFICETLGGYCGYLATLSALAGGADAAYIYEEPFTVEDIKEDATHLAAKINAGLEYGLILRSENAHDYFSTDFIKRLYADQGRETFSVKCNILGQFQEGGRPSPFDRYTGTKWGVRCSEKLMVQILENCNAEGVVYAARPDSCTLIGMQSNAHGFCPVLELADSVDLERQLPADPWWIKLRPLLRILAKNINVHRRSSGSVSLKTGSS